MKMKSKILSVSLSAILLATGLGMGASVKLGNVFKVNYQFVINEEVTKLPDDLDIMSRNNVTYVPLRFLSEKMGIEIDYMPGTITLDNEGYESSSIAKADKKIRDLEEEVAKLKTENEALREEISQSDKISAYRDIPTYNEDAGGFRVTITHLQKSQDENAVMSISIKNSSDHDTYYLDPFKTELIVDGKIYNATIATSTSTATNLGPDETLTGTIDIEGIKDVKDLKAIAKFYYSLNNQEEKTIEVLFQN